MALHGRGVSKDRYAAYLIMARRDLSTKQAGYIDADFLHPPTFPLQSDGGPYIEQLQLRSGLVLVATLCSHWRIPDALLSCHRYSEIQAPVQSNLATCQIQRSAAARRFRSEQTGSKVRIARYSPTRPEIRSLTDLRQ